jgi:hypothetical protein
MSHVKSDIRPMLPYVIWTMAATRL